MTHWSVEEISFAAKLWSEGNSGSQIMQAVNARFGNGRVRNAVLGLMNRKRELFPRRGGASAAAATRRQMRNKVARDGKPRKAPKPIAKATPAPARAELAFTPGFFALADLRANQCRFAVTGNVHPSEHRFCGSATDFGQSYCPHHRGIVYGSGTESERSAARVLLNSVKSRAAA